MGRFEYLMTTKDSLSNKVNKTNFDKILLLGKGG